MNQTFTCDRCKRTGSVRIRKHEDAWSVYIKIVDKHDAMSANTCSAGVDEIRVHSQLGIVAAKKSAA